MTWHRWRKDRTEAKLTEGNGAAGASPAPESIAVPRTRIRKGRRKKVAQAERAKRPSLRVVARQDVRPGKIPHHLAWYYRKETRPAGPFTLEEMVSFLDNGRIGPSTLVWSESIVEDWTPADEVTLLADMLGIGADGN